MADKYPKPWRGSPCFADGRWPTFDHRRPTFWEIEVRGKKVVAVFKEFDGENVNDGEYDVTDEVKWLTVDDQGQERVARSRERAEAKVGG